MVVGDRVGARLLVPAVREDVLGDLVAQCQYAFDKIKRVLAAHGANMNHVVKITAYLTDMKNRLPYAQCYTGNFGNAPLPAHTLIGVAALAFPEMMVEVDVTAITPE